MVAGQLLTQVMDSVATLSLARLLAGVGEGQAELVAEVVRPAQAEAERIWGQINLLGGVCMGCLLYALSILPPQAGRGPIFLGLAAFGAALVTSLFNVLAGGGGTIETILAAVLGFLGVGPAAVPAAVIFRLLNFWLLLPLAGFAYAWLTREPRAAPG